MGHRQELLEGAKQCLSERGYARTTARDIVAASGTNLGSIGYHFGSKEALLTAALIDALGDMGVELERVLAQEADGGSLERLEARWELVIESFSTHRPLWMSTFEAFSQAEHLPALREALAAGYERVRPQMAALILGVDESEVDEQSARTLGSFLLALQAGLAAQWLLDPQHSPSAADLADAVRALVAAVDAEARDEVGRAPSTG